MEGEDSYKLGCRSVGVGGEVRGDVMLGGGDDSYKMGCKKCIGRLGWGRLKCSCKHQVSSYPFYFLTNRTLERESRYSYANKRILVGTYISRYLGRIEYIIIEYSRLCLIY